MINLSISPSLTERTGQAVSRLGDKVPILSVLAADTLVRVHENETIVIAGLMNEPALKGQARAPGIRGLFRRDSHHKGKTDLLILLTPTIMTPARVLQSAAQEQNRVLEKP
jgi:type II secretory pathway component GspD/PulD (secretin)